ncbi:MAG: type III pantothenate kinase [Planctomycetales bacterium]|nr:type III pantothenate kinase [Planctomycetales bacterium]
MTDTRVTDDLIHALDIGNSSAKFGAVRLSDPANVTHTQSLFADDDGFANVRSTAMLEPNKTPWFVASVCRPMRDKFVSWLSAEFPCAPIHHLQNDDCPITIDVEFPNQVGIDRILGAVAANEFRTHGQPAIVVDAGSAITVDAISADGVFLGGVIMAGFAMRTKSLATSTDLLPLIHATGADESPSVIGRSTESAIRSGIFWGTIGSIREIIDRVQTEIGNAQVFVTGGDMVRMTNHLKDDARFIPNLVLTGIAITAKSLGDQS